MGRVIGLTGGIASGKSTVSRILNELGAQIFDADVAAREVVEPGRKGWEELVKEFGRDILNPDNTINRKTLGELVFNNVTARARLNEITHPLVKEKAMEAVAFFREGLGDKHEVLILDIPLLIEAGMTELADEVWLVYVPREVQLERLIARNKLTLHEAEARLNSQMPIDEKIPYADKVINNEGTVEETRTIVVKLWHALQHRA